MNNTQYLTTTNTKKILIPGAKGTPVPITENFRLIMVNDSHYAGVRFNEFSGRAEVHTHKKDGTFEIRPWNDADEAESRNYIESEFGIYSRDKHNDALRLLFRERTYNPVLDIVESVKWDGKSRIYDFLHTWAKVEDTDYTREVSRLIFAGGIHRLYAPGTKFDDVPILMGEQGSGKSTLTRFLATNDKYHGEITTVEGQQAIEQLQGKWICEMSEMLALTKAKEQEAVKAFIARQVDRYRKPWDKNVSELPRRCIMISTTNDYNVLVDKTGNRRFYPITVKSKAKEIYDREDECRDYILQCWAEARELYKAGKIPNYANPDHEDLYKEAQENAMQDDWRAGAIEEYLSKKLPGELTCVRELCHMVLSPNADFPHEPTLAESKDLAKMMNRMPGWQRCESTKRVGSYGKQRAWVKVDAGTEEDPSDPNNW